MSEPQLYNRISIHLSQIRPVLDNIKSGAVSLRFMQAAQNGLEQEAANMCAEMFLHSTPRIPGGTFFLRELQSNLEKIGFSSDQITIASLHLVNFRNEKV